MTAEQSAQAVLEANVKAFNADKKAQLARETDLGKTLISLAEQGAKDPNPVIVFRAGWLHGFLFAHGTPVNAVPAADPSASEPPVGIA